MFLKAQWAAEPEAAEAISLMAARGAKGDAKLAALVRDRQDLLGEWRAADASRAAALSQPPGTPGKDAGAANGARLEGIEARIGELDERLVRDFPDYAVFANPRPASIEEVQLNLRPGEALVFMLDTPEGKPLPEETFIWVITKTNVRWVRSELGTASLTSEVQTLRCGLDAAAWQDRPCGALMGKTYTDADRDAGKPLPFDHALAHKLYKALFGQVEDLIKGKSLLIVPSGPLTQLPFQVLLTAPLARGASKPTPTGTLAQLKSLVTAPPADAASKGPDWLIRHHALTVLPAVSSLKVLRRMARASAATKPLIGFGNPLLDGRLLLDHDQEHPKHDAEINDLAQRATEKQRCPETARQRLAALAGLSRGVASAPMRGGVADADFLRGQRPLPETADELCAVARDLHADPDEIRLGARATESEVKRLSGTGELAQYRVVHFATHGALAGQVTGNTEPGLLLTPPASPSEEDDGYLTASEIAALKLDADWVILSACNTAAGGAQGAEALSGLARAFIYAQARALLVSHWEVDSDATVKLVTGAMHRLAANKGLGRAEALRQSMLALIDGKDPREAHPAFWAPFVVVGEGGAGR